MVRRKKAKKIIRRKKQGKIETSKAANRKALWQAYQDLQKRADAAWEKFRADVRKSAKSDILIRDQNQLLLLLGECNYMARECMRIANKSEKKRE